MIEHRPFTALVGADHGWIKARLHFVPPEMGGDPGRSVGPLIAWNDDEIAGRSGFPAHPHKNVEIVTYVRSGAISHKDNLGNAGSAAAGEVQAMSAGIGIEHSEANPGDVPTRLFQIWLKPRTLGGTPRWGTTSLPHDPGEPRFVPLASGDPEDVGALPINADARVLGVRLKAGTTLEHVLRAGGGYLVPTAGRIAVNGVAVGPRDGCLVRDESSLTIDVHEDTEIVFFELT